MGLSINDNVTQISCAADKLGFDRCPDLSFKAWKSGTYKHISKAVMLTSEQCGKH